LEQNESVGTVDEPDLYFKGQLSMTWGPYLTFTHEAKESPLVYFGAVTDRTIVGLGGSSQNMIGASGSSSAHSHSATAVMVARLYEGLELPLPDHDKRVARRLAFYPHHKHSGRRSNINILLGTPLYVALAK
jgi:hypothetical protein